MKLDILYLDKTPYENGKISWEYFRQRVKIDTTEIEKILSNNDTKKKVETQFNNLKLEFPKYYDEVIWKADWFWIDRLTFFRFDVLKFLIFIVNIAPLLCVKKIMVNSLFHTMKMIIILKVIFVYVRLKLMIIIGSWRMICMKCHFEMVWVGIAMV